MVGGSFHVATDDAAYSEVIRLVLAGEPLLENAYAPASYRSERPDSVPTTFQREWTAQGRTCFFFQYRRRAAAIVGRPDEMRATAHV